MQTRSTANNLKTTRDLADNTQEPTGNANKAPATGSEKAAASTNAPPQQSSEQNQDQVVVVPSRDSTSPSQVFLQSSNSDVKMVRPSQSGTVIMPTSHHGLRQVTKNEEARGRLFCVGISTQTKSSKNLDYVRLSSGDGITLYCKADTSVPFNFRYGPECHPGMKIRIRPEYTEDRYSNKPVERCPNHLVKDNTEARNHFVRCEHPDAEYLGVDDAYAVRIPTCESTGFLFTCFSSCSGGINRRPVQLAFVLEESDGTVLDTCYIALKVCANPLRDASKENGRFEPRMMDSMYSGSGLHRKRLHRFSGEMVKRPRFRSYVDENVSMFEVHLTDLRSLRKVMWMLTNEEKFDQLMGLDKDGYRDPCMLTSDTPIKTWLNRSEIGLGSLAVDFERHSIFTLGDLSRVYRHDTFSRFGFTNDQCIILNRTFQEWNQMNRAIATGQVSVSNGLGHYSHL
ncbi:hypothetical protein Y032_0450g1675 [Ancylostoma ceylanicum]|uniref:Uncharacterized protein n=1 Tax=Ancylostoma ceylanicum TaxID=53326 RepID=A0A016WYV3_9BILA|nr:hypothetical protein Y032_0450g1675 [Ancylostoma ceylanicum]